MSLDAEDRKWLAALQGAAQVCAQQGAELATLREALVWFGNRSGEFKHYWKQLQSWKDATCTHAEAELVRRDYEKYSEMAALLAATEAALGEKGSQ